MYCIAQCLGGRKLQQIAVRKYFSRKRIGGLAALHSKSASIKIMADKALEDWS